MNKQFFSFITLVSFFYAIDMRAADNIVYREEVARQIHERSARATALHRAKLEATQTILAKHFKTTVEELRADTPEELFDGIDAITPLTFDKNEARKKADIIAHKKFRIKTKDIMCKLTARLSKLSKEEQNALNEEIAKRQKENFKEYLNRCKSKKIDQGKGKS